MNKPKARPYNKSMSIRCRCLFTTLMRLPWSVLLRFWKFDECKAGIDSSGADH